jgi:periodic tryptophan protein 1
MFLATHVYDTRVFAQVLASGSADCTVKLWDVSSQQCSTTLTHHTDKVQALAWHPTEAAVLATASYDKTV